MSQDNSPVQQTSNTLTIVHEEGVERTHSDPKLTLPLVVEHNNEAPSISSSRSCPESFNIAGITTPVESPQNNGGKKKRIETLTNFMEKIPLKRPSNMSLPLSTSTPAPSLTTLGESNGAANGASPSGGNFPELQIHLQAAITEEPV